MLEILRNPPKPLQFFYLAMTAFIAIWAGSVAGQVPEDRSGLGAATLYTGYAVLPLLILPFAVEYKSVKLHAALCFVASLLIIFGFMVGYNSVNETAPRTWFEPLILIGFATVMVFPMLIVSAAYYGLGKLAEHLGVVPSFLRA